MNFNNVRVQQFKNRNGKSVVDQFIISSKGNILFQSYESAIALKDKSGVVHLSKHWDYSTTTSKCLTYFLRSTDHEIQTRIDSGLYSMDLNLDGSLDKVGGNE